MEAQYLRKIDDANKSYIYAWTPALSMQSNMIPCDKAGKPVGVAGEVLGDGLRPREPIMPNEELKIALESIAKLKAENEALKAGGAAPVDETKDTPDEPDDNHLVLTDMDRTPLYEHLKEVYGEKADYLKGNMSKSTLLEEAEKLQAAADLAATMKGATQ